MDPSDPKRLERHDLAYRLSRNLAWLAAAFVLVVATLLVGNYLETRRVDPLDDQALKSLINELGQRPDDEALKSRIRKLDQLGRHAFFVSQEFKRKGTYALAFGLLILIVALKTMTHFQRETPNPRNREEPTPLSVTKRRARWLVAGLAGIILVTGGVLVMLFPVRIIPGSQVAQAKAYSPPDRADFQKNWPGFRGPGGIGSTSLTGMPTSWNGETGEGVLWKVEVPRQGYGSPAVWGQRVFLSAADDSGREVIAFDARNGETLWRREIKGFPGSPQTMPEVTPDTGHAAASVATDGTHVFAIFSNGDLVALDLEGEIIWGKNLGVPANHYGHSSSLLVFKDLLMVQFDHDQKGRLFALEVTSGDVAWEVERAFKTSWASPIIANGAVQPELILNANPYVVSYDPRSGAELWRLECLSGEVAPSPAYANGMVFAVNQYARLAAIDLKTRQMRWEAEYDLPDICSPVAVDDLLFVPTSDGVISCFDAKTGEVLWLEEFEYGFHASPIQADGKVYAMDTSGVMYIFKPSRQYELVATSALGERAESTPAFYDGRIYYRGERHLYCLGPTP